jgi:hypothetical protein
MYVLHDATYQKTVIFILSAVRTRNLTQKESNFYLFLRQNFLAQKTFWMSEN